jgi:hypothetical protein
MLGALVSVALPGEEDDAPVSVQISRTTEALRKLRLALALAHVQTAGLCCNSFTILSRHTLGETEGDIVRMRNVRFEDIAALLDFTILGLTLLL